MSDRTLIPTLTRNSAGALRVGRASRCNRAINRCRELFNVIVIINPPGVLFTLAFCAHRNDPDKLSCARSRAGGAPAYADGCSGRRAYA